MNSLSEAQRATALERYQTLKPFLEGTCTLPEAIKSYELPLRTARGWVARYRAIGLTGLARGTRRTPALESRDPSPNSGLGKSSKPTLSELHTGFQHH